MTRLPFKKQTIAALALCVAATALRGGAADGPRLVEAGDARVTASVRLIAVPDADRGPAQSVEAVAGVQIVDAGL